MLFATILEIIPLLRTWAIETLRRDDVGGIWTTDSQKHFAGGVEYMQFCFRNRKKVKRDISSRAVSLQKTMTILFERRE